MWKSVLLVISLVTAPSLSAQQASADSAAIVALELEMSRLLLRGRIDEYARYLAPDYARTTREGVVERREAALASWRARKPAGPTRPVDLWLRVYGDAAVLTGAIAAGDTNPPPPPHHEDLRASARAVAAGRASRVGDPAALTRTDRLRCRWSATSEPRCVALRRIRDP